MEKIKKMKELLSKATELIEAEDIYSEDVEDEDEENYDDACVIIAVSNGKLQALSAGYGITIACGIGELLVTKPQICSIVLKYIMKHNSRYQVNRKVQPGKSNPSH